jgi:hypothetical protein
VAFSHPEWSNDTTVDYKSRFRGEFSDRFNSPFSAVLLVLFGANLASVPLRLFQSKPLPVENMILVQDKGRWSRATPSSHIRRQ